ncbi:peptide chain release factor family protein [Candidatus Omnitrophota bacterium]
MEDKVKRLRREMARSGLYEKDLLERFIRSQGPGGQNVNKTSTCVYLKHIPTGIEVKCQQERSQPSNRYSARRLLLKRIEERKQKKLLLKRQRREKIKRQKRKRPKRVKERILETKRRRSEKKKLRFRVREEEF